MTTDLHWREAQKLRQAAGAGEGAAIRQIPSWDSEFQVAMAGQFDEVRKDFFAASLMGYKTTWFVTVPEVVRDPRYHYTVRTFALLTCPDDVLAEIERRTGTADMAISLPLRFAISEPYIPQGGHSWFWQGVDKLTGERVFVKQ